MHCLRAMEDVGNLNYLPIPICVLTIHSCLLSDFIPAKIQRGREGCLELS